MKRPKSPLPPRRRVEIDARGRARRETEFAPGQWKNGVDTQQVRTLSGHKLSLEERVREKQVVPYGEAAPTEKKLKIRNGLDHMRALSEAIKRQRVDPPEE